MYKKWGTESRQKDQQDGRPGGVKLSTSKGIKRPPHRDLSVFPVSVGRPEFPRVTGVEAGL